MIFCRQNSSFNPFLLIVFMQLYAFLSSEMLPLYIPRVVRLFSKSKRQIGHVNKKCSNSNIQANKKVIPRICPKLKEKSIETCWKQNDNQCMKKILHIIHDEISHEIAYLPKNIYDNILLRAVSRARLILTFLFLSLYFEIYH